MFTKQEMIDSGSISDQQALVEKLIGNGPRILKRVIPGGRTLMEQVDKQIMAKTIYTWLRGCSSFTQVKLSMAREPEKYPLKVSKVVNFTFKDNKPFWERELGGRRTLAEQLAEIVNRRQFVYLEARLDGIYIAEDTSKKFGPTVVVTEALAKTPDFAGLEVGSKVPSPEWEPYVEFVPTLKGRFSVVSRS